MLSRKEPGPGYVHFRCGPNGEIKGGWDADAVAELTAYRRQTNIRGYTVSRWYKRSGRPNHRLDCLVYALAGLARSRLKIDDCELQRVEARNIGKPDEQKNHSPSPFGAQTMIITGDLYGAGTNTFGVVKHPRKSGFGAAGSVSL